MKKFHIKKSNVKLKRCIAFVLTTALSISIISNNISFVNANASNNVNGNTAIENVQEDMELPEEGITGDVRNSDLFDVSIEPRYGVSGDVSLNLQNSYDVTASFATPGGTNVGFYPEDSNVFSAPFVLGEKDLIFGDAAAARNGVKQVVTVSSKFKVNYRRAFRITGFVSVPINPDGFAVAFHRDEGENNQGFKSKNSAGSFGFYKHSGGNNHARYRGLEHATVMEVDSFWNQDAQGAYGEPNRAIRHIAIQETGAEGLMTGLQNQSYYKDGRTGLINYIDATNAPFDRLVPFTIEWGGRYADGLDSKYKGLSFTYGGYNVKAPNTQLVKMREIMDANNHFGYITFSGSAVMNEVKTPFKLTLSQFQYVDVDPTINTKINPNPTSDHRENYVMPGERFTIQHEFYNKKNTEESLMDDMYLKTLKPKWVRNAENLTLDTGISYHTEEGQWLENYDRGKGFSQGLYVFYHTKLYQNDTAKYRYQVTAPGGLALGTRSAIEFQYNIGGTGMTQTVHKGEFPVRANNKITSNNKTDVDLIPVNSVSQITEQKLWENIRVDSSGLNGSGTEYREELLGFKEMSKQDMNVDYVYYENDRQVGKTLPTPVAGNVYGLKVTITDKNGDPRLTNSVMKVMYAGQYKSGKEISGSNGIRTGKVLFANDSTAPIVATQLNTMRVDAFVNHVRANTSPRVYNVTKDNITTANDEARVDTSHWLHPNFMTNLDKKAGKHQVGIYISDHADTLIQVFQTVTDNAYSVDDGVNAANGTTGYVIIPSGIELVDKKEGNVRKIVAEPQIFFAQYLTNTRYDVYVTKSVELINTRDPNKKFTVNSSRIDAGTPGPNENYIGTIGNGNGKNNPLRFKLEANRDEHADIIDNGSSWKGTLTFSFRLV